MATGKKSFVLYADLIEKIDHLTDEEKGKLFWHIIQYVNDKDPKLTDRLLLSAWKPIKASLDADLKKWRETRAKRAESGKKGGLAKASNAKQSQANLAVTVTDTVTDTVSTNVDDMHPTLSEVMEKVLELYGEEVVHSMSEFFRDSAKAFFYYYDSQGWVKGNGMTLTKWETKLKEWVEKDRREQRPRPELPKSNPAAEKAEHFKNAPTLKRGMI